MIGTCVIHGVVVDIIVATDPYTKEEIKFCGHCVKEKLLQERYSGKALTTADACLRQ